MMESPVKERALQLAIGATVIAVNLAAFGNCYVFRHKCETFLNPACAAGGCMDLCEQGCLDAFLGESGVTIISPTVREATCTRYCGTSSGNWFQGSCTTPPGGSPIALGRCSGVPGACCYYLGGAGGTSYTYYRGFKISPCDSESDTCTAGQ